MPSPDEPTLMKKYIPTKEKGLFTRISDMVHIIQIMHDKMKQIMLIN